MRELAKVERRGRWAHAGRLAASVGSLQARRGKVTGGAKSNTGIFLKAGQQRAEAVTQWGWHRLRRMARGATHSGQ